MIAPEEERRRTPAGHVPVRSPRSDLDELYWELQLILPADTLTEKEFSKSCFFFWKCSDEVNSGKGHYLLLMLVIKSKPITEEEDADKERQTGWRRI